jgi:hypothetical protein
MKTPTTEKRNTTKNLNINLKTKTEPVSNFTFKGSPKKIPNSSKNFKIEMYPEMKNRRGPLDTTGRMYYSNKNYLVTYQNVNTEHSNNGNMARVNTLQPFKKVDHDFYVDTQSSLWGKELQKIQTEKKMFGEKKLSEKNLRDFGGVNVV